MKEVLREHFSGDVQRVCGSGRPVHQWGGSCVSGPGGVVTVWLCWDGLLGCSVYRGEGGGDGHSVSVLA